MHDYHGYHMLWPMFWALFGLSFWLVNRIIRHRANMKKLDLAKSFAEKGVPIPPELAAAFAPEPRRDRTPACDLRVGLILLAVAAALVVVGVILVFVMKVPAYPVFGGAAFPGLIGAVYLGLGLTRTKS